MLVWWLGTLLTLWAAGPGSALAQSPEATQRIAFTPTGFQPPRLTLRAGDAVTWTNLAGEPITLVGPADAWTIGPIPPGRTSARLTLDAAGTFTYRTREQPDQTGTLIVEATVPAAPSPGPAPAGSPAAGSPAAPLPAPATAESSPVVGAATPAGESTRPVAPDIPPPVTTLPPPATTDPNALWPLLIGGVILLVLGAGFGGLLLLSGRSGTRSDGRAATTGPVQERSRPRPRNAAGTDFEPVGVRPGTGAFPGRTSCWTSAAGVLATICLLALRRTRR